MSPHKRQLHERILERQSELRARLRKSENHKITRSLREVAVEDALATLEIHVSLGWDQVDDMLALELCRWLQRTQLLVEDGPADSLHAA